MYVRHKHIHIVALVFLNFIIVVCEVRINGAGGTLEGEIYSDIMFSRSFVSGNLVTYNPVGSGAGIHLLEANAIDFCGSDKVISESDYEMYPDLQMYPTLAAAVALYHNLDVFRENRQVLVLSRKTVANIFMGKVYFWDDFSIKRSNPNITLPHAQINVYVRADDSGTTAIFTEGLSKFYANFSNTMGQFSAPSGWCQGSTNTSTTHHHRGGITYFCQSCARSFSSSHPLTVCFLTAERMVDMVSIDPFGLSYSVYNPANHQSVQMASMINKAGRVVEASTTSVSYSAMELGGSFTPRLTANLLDSGSSFGWPLASYTYLVMRKQTQMSSCAVRKAVVEFWVWYYQSDEGRRLISNKGFTPLPQFITNHIVEHLVADIQCVDPQGSFFTATPDLLQTQLHTFFLSDSIGSGFQLLNNIYSSFVEETQTWDAIESTSSDILVQLNSNESQKTIFSIFSPALAGSVQNFTSGDGFTFPYFMTAVVPVFSIAGGPSAINLTAEVLADIFLCRISAWNDPAILSLNPELEPVLLSNQTITVVHRVGETDTTAVLNRFLSRNSHVFKESGNQRNFQSPCPLSLGVQSELSMGAAMKYTNGALGYVTIMTAETNQLQRVNLVSQNSLHVLSASVSTVRNCDTRSESAQTLSGSLSQKEVYLDIPFVDFWESSCWPITSVQNMFVKSLFVNNSTTGESSCSEGKAAGNYVLWLLEPLNVFSIFMSNFFIPTSSAGWKTNRIKLLHNMICEESLLLMDIPLCTPQSYVYSIGPCEGFHQSIQVVYSAAVNRSECIGGYPMPEPVSLRCNHILPGSFYGQFITILSGIGIMLCVGCLALQVSSLQNFLNEGYARALLNALLLLVALSCCIFVCSFNLGPVTDSTCFLRPWFWNVPLDFLFSVLYAKTRIGFGIFSEKKIKKVTTPPKVILRWICQVMVGEIVILVLWSALSPPKAVINHTLEVFDSFSFVEVPVEMCTSKHEDVFSTLLLVYQMVLYTLGCFMALKITVGATIASHIWNMKNQHGETRYVGLAMFNFTLSSTALSLVFKFAQSSGQEMLIFLSSLLTIWISTSTSLLSFWPALKKIRKKGSLQMRTMFVYSRLSPHNSLSSGKIESGIAQYPLDSSRHSTMSVKSRQEKDRAGAAIVIQNNKGHRSSLNVLEPLKEVSDERPSELTFAQRDCTDMVCASEVVGLSLTPMLPYIGKLECYNDNSDDSHILRDKWCGANESLESLCTVNKSVDNNCIPTSKYLLESHSEMIVETI